MNRYFLNISLILMIIVAAAFLLYVPPYTASNMNFEPDSVEYALGAKRLLNNGSFDILINKRPYPSRYPPWFSTLFIAPAYLLIGSEPGNAVIPIVITGVMGVLAAWFIGKKISGDSGALFASIFLLISPVYRLYSGQILSDIPCTFLALTACVIFLKTDKQEILNHRFLFLAGCICGVSTALRPASSALLLPFTCIILKRKTGRAANLFALYLLPAVFGVLTAAYNKTVFSSFFRNGYHYWCAVPYDYFSLTFSFSYLSRNVSALIASNFPLLVMAGIFLLILINRRFQRRFDNNSASVHSIKSSFFFLCIGAAPTALLHMIYFFPSERFFLPCLALASAIIGSLLGTIIPNISRARILLAHSTLLLASLVFAIYREHPAPAKRSIAEAVFASTPPDAVIVTSIEAPYFNLFDEKIMDRTIFPISRNVEYASKVASLFEIKSPAPLPSSAFDHRCLGLILGGAKEVFPFAALERPDILEKLILKGTTVFATDPWLDKRDTAAFLSLKKRFDFYETTPLIYQLKIKTSPESSQEDD